MRALGHVYYLLRVRVRQILRVPLHERVWRVPDARLEATERNSGQLFIAVGFVIRALRPKVTVGVENS